VREMVVLMAVPVCGLLCAILATMSGLTRKGGPVESVLPWIPLLLVVVILAYRLGVIHGRSHKR
jgi:hypothetical protein